MAPGASGVLGNEGLVWGASRREAPETNGNEDIVGIIPMPTTNPCTHVQCVHARRWTDRHKCVHTHRFMAHQEGASPGEPA